MTVRLGDDVLSLLEDIKSLFATVSPDITVTSPEPLYPPELHCPDGVTAEQLVALRDWFQNSYEGAAIRGLPLNDSFVLLYNMEVESFDVGRVVFELTEPILLRNTGSES